VAKNAESFWLQVCILDGNKYASRCREAGEQRSEILDECEVLRNQKGEPLLVAGSASNDATNPRVILKFPGSSHAVTLRYAKHMDFLRRAGTVDREALGRGGELAEKEGSTSCHLGRMTVLVGEQ
jgi:hypothetical protein